MRQSNMDSLTWQTLNDIRYSTGTEREIDLQLKVDPIKIDVSKAISWKNLGSFITQQLDQMSTIGISLQK